jgi:excisionase family DNA binding protein
MQATASGFERVRDLPGWTRLSLPYWERIVSERRIPVYRVGRAVLVKRADVEAFIAKGFEPARLPESGPAGGDAA